MGRWVRRDVRGALTVLGRPGERDDPVLRCRRGSGRSRRQGGTAGVGCDAAHRAGQGAAPDQRALRRARRADRSRAGTGDRQDHHRVSGGGARIRGAGMAEGRRGSAPAPWPVVPVHAGADEQQAPGDDASAAGRGRRHHPVQLPDRHLVHRARAHRGRRQHRRVEAVRVRGDIVRHGRGVLRPKPACRTA